jgi:hypothetical protein
MLEPLASYTWPTDRWPLAALSIRVDELATRLGLSILTWHEDGLGPARGVVCGLPSGRVFLLQELENKVRYYNAKGPDVYVDAGDVGDQGVEPMLIEVLDGLQLSRSDVNWLPDATSQQSAAKFAAEARAAKAQRPAEGRDCPFPT